MKTLPKILAMSLSLSLAACGGGGGGSSTPSTVVPAVTAPTVTPQNALLWSGTTSTQRVHDIVLFDSGRTYMLYSTAADPAVTGGVIIGSAASSGSSLAVQSVDFSWEGLPGAELNISGSLNSSAGYDGAATYTTDSSRNFSFTSSYREPSAQVITMTDLAGTYVGTDRTTSLTINASGLIHGIAFESGCAFLGSIAPTRTYTTVLQMALTFQGGSCSFGTSTLEGIALYDPVLRTLRGVALVSTGTRAALFQANKT